MFSLASEKRSSSKLRAKLIVVLEFAVVGGGLAGGVFWLIVRNEQQMSWSDNVSCKVQPVKEAGVPLVCVAGVFEQSKQT